MKHPLLVYCAVAAMLVIEVPRASAQDVAATIKKAEYALGMIRGPRRIDAINTLEYWGNGHIYSLGQAYRPGGPWPPYKVTTKVSLSYALPAMRVESTRDNPEGLVQGGGLGPLAVPEKQIQVVSGSFAWNESTPGAGFIPGSTATPLPGTVRDRLLQLWTTPFGVLKAAEKAGPSAKVSTEGAATVITFPLTGQLTGITVKATLNSKNQVEKVETPIEDPVLGDVVLENTYSDYQDLGEIKTDVLFPAHIVQKEGGFPILDLTITRADLNNPYVVFPVPDVVEKAPPAGPAKADAQKLADGVWYLTGGNYNSVAVEFKDYVALVECPQNDERTLAIIQAAKAAIPGKPIRYAVNTHHHFDHSGGLRACVAEGATIITQADNKPYYEKVWALPHTLAPDALAKSPQKPVIEGVINKRVITDGKQTLELYHLEGSNHASTMLIGFLPKEKILIEADVFNPPPQGALSLGQAKEKVLYENLQRLKLDVRQIAPIHGKAASIEDLRKAIGAN